MQNEIEKMPAEDIETAAETSAGKTADSPRSFVAGVFRALDKQGIRYCIFRDYHKLEQPTRDVEIDLLADPADLKKLRQLLARKGFVEIPSWGHAPHRFFVTYHKALNMWLKLDVITALRFGKPVSALEIGLRSSYLDHRTRRELAFVPAAEDKFLVLLLKCIINDGKFSESRLRRLRELHNEILADPVGPDRISANLQKHLGNRLSWEEIDRAFQAADWQQLLAKRKSLRRKLFASQPLATLWRQVKTRFLKRISPLLYLLRRRGVSVALLAPDGAGKSTLAETIIRQRHLNARFIYMGDNLKASNVGLPTTPWFKRKKKQKRNNPLIKLILAVFNFPNSLLEQWYRSAVGGYYRSRGKFVVYDRYVYDSWINPPVTRMIKKIRRFLIERTCPTPDLVILLDAPGAVLFDRKGEHTPEGLETKRQAYLALQKQLSNLLVVDATQDAQTVQAEVIHMLWQYYRTRDLGKVRNGRNGQSG